MQPSQSPLQVRWSGKNAEAVGKYSLVRAKKSNEIGMVEEIKETGWMSYSRDAALAMAPVFSQQPPHGIGRPALLESPIAETEGIEDQKTRKP